MKLKTKRRTQFAALPFWVRDGEPEVMVITSRETGRWIIPKGWPVKNLGPAAVAAREAYEEAGLVGKVSKRPVGSYRYDKRLPSDNVVECKVYVFLLEVKEQLDQWPEQNHRERCWLTPTEAAQRVVEAELSSLLRGIATQMANGETRSNWVEPGQLG